MLRDSRGHESEKGVKPVAHIKCRTRLTPVSSVPVAWGQHAQNNWKTDFMSPQSFSESEALTEIREKRGSTSFKSATGTSCDNPILFRGAWLVALKLRYQANLNKANFSTYRNHRDFPKRLVARSPQIIDIKPTKQPIDEFIMTICFHDQERIGDG